jgi:hypothetical protein
MAAVDLVKLDVNLIFDTPDIFQFIIGIEQQVAQQFFVLFFVFYQSHANINYIAVGQCSQFFF